MRFGDRFFGGILVRSGIGRIGGAAHRDARVVMAAESQDASGTYTKEHSL
jgi:hypothetical protein